MKINQLPSILTSNKKIQSGQYFLYKSRNLLISQSFISFFLLNYKNVVKIEVLRGYNYDGNGNMNINDPIWSLLTEDLYRNYQNTQGTILCRIMPYEDELYGIKRHPILEMPIYNKFFTIKPCKLTYFMIKVIY